MDHTHHSGGNGLTNMKKRLDDIGGSFEIESHPGKGTAIKLKIEKTPEA
jgi:signal transduction histidine kinase